MARACSNHPGVPIPMSAWMGRKKGHVIINQLPSTRRFQGAAFMNSAREQLSSTRTSRTAGARKPTLDEHRAEATIIFSIRKSGVLFPDSF